MLHVACCLWDANEKSQSFSRCYDEEWVNRLYRGFARNLTRPFRFGVLTDRKRQFVSGVEQERLATSKPDYGCLIEPFRLNEPVIVCGLDMVVLRNIDHFADYCMTADKIALPRNPYKVEQSINPVAFVPAGHRHIFDGWRGENDMEWLRRQPTEFIDDLWPGQVLSLKAHKIRDTGPGDARIIYMHGSPKAHELQDHQWVRDNWK